MNLPTSRRHFLKTTATTGALLGLGDLSFLSQLSGVSCADAQVNPKSVRFQPEIEPLVRLLEETSRAAFLEEVAHLPTRTRSAAEHLRSRHPIRPNTRLSLFIYL